MKKTVFALIAALIVLATFAGGVSASFVISFNPTCDNVGVVVGQGTSGANAAGGSVTLYFFKNGAVVGTSSAPLSAASGGYTATVAYPAGFDKSTPFSISARIYNASNAVIGGISPVAFAGVICEPPPPPPGNQGCTPGYWRNHLDSWVKYNTGADYETTFGISTNTFTATLVEAVNFGGGGEYALARHAVASLLNASNNGVNAVYTEAQVISMVQSAYASGDYEGTKNLFETANELGCPLN